MVKNVSCAAAFSAAVSERKGEGISPEPDFAQFWIATHSVDVSDMRDLLSRYFILVSNTDVDLVHRTFALDVPRYGTLAPFWVNYTDSMAPTAAVWREWVRSVPHRRRQSVP